MKDEVRVGIWIRLSGSDNTSDSVAYHRRVATEYAEARGWIVEKEYVMVKVSGARLRGHKETERMRRDVRDEVIHKLLFTKIPRLGRDALHVLHTVEYLRHYGATFVSVKDKIDTSTVQGWHQFQLKVVDAQHYREVANETSEDARLEQLNMVADGTRVKKQGGMVHFGYCIQDGKYVKDSATAPLRLQMYYDYVKHKNIKAISIWLNEMRVKPPKGRQFWDSTVREMLLDPVVVGVLQFNHTHLIPEIRQWVETPLAARRFGEAEPLFNEDDVHIWYQCQAILAADTTGRPRQILGSGLAFCQIHNAKLKTYKDGRRMRCGTCKQDLYEPDVEQIVQTWLELYTAGSIRLSYAALQQEVARNEELLNILSRQKPSSPKSAGTGRQTDKTAPAQLDSLKHLKYTLNTMRQRLATLEPAKTVELSIPEFWRRLEFEEKRTLTDLIIKRLDLMHNGEVRVEPLQPFQAGEGSSPL